MASPTNEEVDQLKELGNQAFKGRNYRQAINLYTKALESALSTTALETQRTILANRAQAYMSYGDIHDALRDVNHALSSRYTSQESPKNLTVKCRYRRAKLLCIMARYEEAHRDYAEFMHLVRELGTEISEEQQQWKENIECGANASEDSERRQKDELMRAVDARGFLLRQPYRKTFPLPPPDMQERLGPDFDPEEMILHFNTRDGRPNRRLTDPNLTSISIPMYIRAPYFKADPTSATPFSTREEIPVSENETVGSFSQDLFASLARYYSRSNRDSTRSAVEHDHHSVVLVITSHGRILLIPRKTRIKDIVAGARWPRPQDAQEIPVFEDLRKEPRAKDDKIDGIEVYMGWFMELYFIPEENLAEFIDTCERSINTV